jgi:MraZ protein
VSLFLSNYINRVDKKGRVSVPANFRAILTAEAFQGIILYESFINPCLEACSMSHMEELYNHIDGLDPFAEERDAFATTILGNALQLNFDSEGRIVLSNTIMQDYGLIDQVLFVGKGKTFELWNKQNYEQHAIKARELALAARHKLRKTPK